MLEEKNKMHNNFHIYGSNNNNNNTNPPVYNWYLILFISTNNISLSYNRISQTFQV